MTPRRSAAPRLLVSVSGSRLPTAARGLAGWLAAAAPRSAKGTVDIALISDVRMRALNRTFRKVDASTDVLSFPAEADRSATRARSTGPATAASADDALGDIAIALGVAARQARAEGHSLRVELRVLALHGLLHLLGYDHDRDEGQMRRLEERLRRRAGLDAGLISRGQRARRP